MVCNAHLLGVGGIAARLHAIGAHLAHLCHMTPQAGFGRAQNGRRWVGVEFQAVTIGDNHLGTQMTRNDGQSSDFYFFDVF